MPNTPVDLAFQTAQSLFDKDLAQKVNGLASLCHADNYKWWHDKNGKRLKLNDGERIALMHSELSEALEGVRKDKMDDHLPEFKSVAVEMADTLIRILDYCAANCIPVGEAFAAKRRYNAVRADHTREARNAPGGKKF